MLFLFYPNNRTQTSNKATCVKKLRIMLDDAYIEPKDRVQYDGIGTKGKSINKKNKQARSDIKASRSQKNKFDD